MRFVFTVTFAVLLALSQRLWTTQAHTDSLSRLLKLAFIPEQDVDVVYVKRTVPQLTEWFQARDNLAQTWSGFTKEPHNSGWNEKSIQEVAKTAWKETQPQSRPTPLLVAALWIPGTGVYLGSQVRGTSTLERISAQARFDNILLNQAKVAWFSGKLKDRENHTVTKWHAEDVAMWMFEKEEKPEGPKYPSGSYMVIYGQYNNNDGLGFKKPCGTRGTQDSSSITPGCYTVLKELGIRWDRPLGK